MVERLSLSTKSADCDAQEFGCWCCCERENCSIEIFTGDFVFEIACFFFGILLLRPWKLNNCGHRAPQLLPHTSVSEEQMIEALDAMMHVAEIVKQGVDIPASHRISKSILLCAWVFIVVCVPSYSGMSVYSIISVRMRLWSTWLCVIVVCDQGLYSLLKSISFVLSLILRSIVLSRRRRREQRWKLPPHWTVQEFCYRSGKPWFEVYSLLEMLF